MLSQYQNINSQHMSTQRLAHKCLQKLYSQLPHSGNNPHVHQQVNELTECAIPTQWNTTVQ